MAGINLTNYTRIRNLYLPTDIQVGICPEANRVISETNIGDYVLQGRILVPESNYRFEHHASYHVDSDRGRNFMRRYGSDDYTGPLEDFRDAPPLSHPYFPKKPLSPILLP